MKHAAAILVLLFAAVPAKAQQGNTVTRTGFGAPTGSCAYIQFYVDSSNGNLYDCFGGTWNLISSGGGGSSAWSALTPGTNSNAGSFISTGNTWDFSGAASFILPSTNTTGLPGTNGQLLYNNGGALGAEDPVVSQPTASLLNATVVQPSGANLHADIDNFPATQPVSGSVSVSNLPATQPVSGSVTVTNLPTSTQSLAAPAVVTPVNPSIPSSIKVTNGPFNPVPVTLANPTVLASLINGNCNATTVIAHAYCGNNTSSSGAPGFVVPNLGDIASSSSANNYTFTGAIQCTIVNAVRCISPSNPQGWAGSDFGAWVNSAFSNCGAGCEVQVAGDATYTQTTAITTTPTRSLLRFGPNVTVTYSASITLGQQACMVGPPGAWSDDDVSINSTSVKLIQANGANIATAIIAPNPMSCLQDITIDGNRANNATGTVGVLITNQRFHFFRTMIEEFSSDGVQNTSTGTTDNAAAIFAMQSAFIRNTGNAVACTNSSDTRIWYSFLEFNGKAGFSGTNCNSPIIGFNEISSNTPGISLTGSSTSNVLTGSYPIIAMNSGANNICTAVGANLGADININGFDGTVGGQVPDTMIEVNRWVGSNDVNNTCDSIHIQDSANTIIKGNTFSSNAGHTYRYEVGIFSVSATEGRDNVEGNNFLGTFGTASHIGTTATVFQNNNENGSGTLEEFDVNNLVIPNNQAWQVKNGSGTATNWITPVSSGNVSFFWVPIQLNGGNWVSWGESTAPSGTATLDLCYGDSTAHALECSYNNGSFGIVPLLSRANTWTAAQTIGAGGSINAPNLLISPTVPTITAAGCGGSAAAIQNANGTLSFNVFTGTAPTSGGCTITMPAATTDWHCNANHTSAISTTNFIILQTGAVSTTSVTLQLFSDVAAATAPTASDTWRTTCTAN